MCVCADMFTWACVNNGECLNDEIMKYIFFFVALDAWLEYRNCIQEIDAILDKFDSDGDRVCKQK
jgi:hypothetical protein